MIYKYMDLSTSHMTKEDNEWLQRYIASGVLLPMRVISHEYGYFINISSKLDDNFEQHIKELEDFNFSNMFIIAYQYAHENDCTWINFDQDGEIDDKIKHSYW